MGNLISVKNIFEYLGCKTTITSKYNDIKNFSHIILPELVLLNRLWIT